MPLCEKVSFSIKLKVENQMVIKREKKKKFSVWSTDLD